MWFYEEQNIIQTAGAQGWQVHISHAWQTQSSVHWHRAGQDSLGQRAIGGIFIYCSYNTSKPGLTCLKAWRMMWIQNRRGVTSYQCDSHHLLKMPYTTTDCSLWSIHTRSISVLTTPPSVQAPNTVSPSLFALLCLYLNWAGYKAPLRDQLVSDSALPVRSSRGGSQTDPYCCHKVALFNNQTVIGQLYKPYKHKHVKTGWYELDVDLAHTQENETDINSYMNTDKGRLVKLCWQTETW